MACDAVGHAAGLVAVEVGGLAGVDLAEVAAPRALVAADQEGRLAVFPALVDVGAAGCLAHRVQAFALHQRLQFGVGRPHLRSRLDPGGLPLDRDGGVSGLDPEQATPVANIGSGELRGVRGGESHDVELTPGRLPG